MNTNPTAWTATHPESVGLYIASVERRADSVRFWTGKHWTAPVMVYDLRLLDRIPAADGPPGAPARGHVIEWLEPVTLDAQGFISWGGRLSESPLHRDVSVEVRFRQDDSAGPPVQASRLRWNHLGNGGDIVAYRVVEQPAAAPQPANDPVVERRAPGTKDTNPKDAAASGRVPMHLVPDSLVLYAAMGFAEGDSKYIGYNFRVAGVRAMVYVSALRRHLMRYVNGEWADKKTGVPHLASVACCVSILIDGHVVGNIVDDRPPAVDLNDEIEEAERIIAHCYKMNQHIRAAALVKEYTALSTGRLLTPHTPHSCADSERAA